MPTAALTGKGQITIPADVRRALDDGAGDGAESVQIEAGCCEVVAATRSVREPKGRFGKTQATVAIDAMSAAIAVQGAGAR